ncbi:methyltransferase domain-containing protein [Erythrobacteraceae bacterium CFH 75059]|uniref:50S ribosomal protein L11 methyltransferase n=1 Tax=Qipengyuania thermophila TaxID=2509361 RepID=UPI00101F0D21|nr:50S ribosomal protein L11 methyltransferase [Qipengyuania thermophila]TCD05353.1 methyltransferase domain-containing protein [Erythrobacteraceae bacterium CFH 75059]
MSADTWKITAVALRGDVEAALAALDGDGRMVLSGREVAEDSEEWVLEAWLSDAPDEDDLARFAALLPVGPDAFRVERLTEQDWITLSQQGMEPVVAGRFHVRTPDHPTAQDGARIDLVIPASQAFGTGQHETTAGCLAMLDRLERCGERPGRIVDVGTGTGVLAFAAARLWPGATIFASDVDPVCAGVVRDNAARNGVALGTGAGEVAIVTAAGLDHPDLRRDGAFDLVIANILAGPLIEIAGQLTRALAPAGHLILAGLLTRQQDEVLQPYADAGMTLRERLMNGDWSILWLERTRS